MIDPKSVVFDIIDNVNLTDNECALIQYFHEQLTDAEIKTRAATGVGTTYLHDGIFSVEWQGHRSVIHHGFYHNEWPEKGNDWFDPNMTLHKIGCTLLTNFIAMDYPDITFRSAHFITNVNDGDAAGVAPWNIAPSMPQHIKDAGFDCGWLTSSFFRFRQSS